jgi:hypothetical protein
VILIPFFFFGVLPRVVAEEDLGMLSTFEVKSVVMMWW